jgi:hypothetical protein
MKRLSVLAFVTFVTLVCAARADVVADPWAAWSGNFNSVMSACVAAAQPNCLSKAFTSLDRPAAGDFVADDLYRDLRTAEVLLHQKDASDALWKLYGVDSSAYLGTTYSVPLAGEGAKNYAFAVQREFFVPNLCAEAVDPVLCPIPNVHVWTWRLDAAALTHWGDRPIVELLHAQHPTVDAAGFAKQHAAEDGPGNMPTLLIRFGALQPAYYKGTFGRPDAKRVFFADYAQVRGKTLRSAMTATGASTLLDNPDPSKTTFIWIYAPALNDGAAPASWKELFRLLAQPQ